MTTPERKILRCAIYTPKSTYNLDLEFNSLDEQVETLAEQHTQLAALPQKAMIATAEPLKTGVAAAFNHAA